MVVSVVEAVNAALTQANRYPEFLPRQLPKLIAGHLGIHPEQVVVGSGATGAAMQIIRALAAPGSELVTAVPTFDGYPIMAEMARLTLVPVPLDNAGGYDLRATHRAFTARTALVVLCRPHNPTGTVIPAAELIAFLELIPSHTTVVLDEAYGEFLAPADYLDHVALLRRHHRIGSQNSPYRRRTRSLAYRCAPSVSRYPAVTPTSSTSRGGDGDSTASSRYRREVLSRRQCSDRGRRPRSRASCSRGHYLNAGPCDRYADRCGLGCRRAPGPNRCAGRPGAGG